MNLIAYHFERKTATKRNLETVLKNYDIWNGKN